MANILGPLQLDVDAKSSSQVRRIHIDSPKDGHVDDQHGFILTGWIIGATAPVDRIRVRTGQVVLAEGSVDRPRPKAAKLHKAATERVGFHLFVTTFGLGRDFDLKLDAIVGDQVFLLGTIKGIRQTAVPPIQPGLLPIMVTGGGRNGSTLMMKILSSHPDVVSVGKYPDETRMAGYWTRIAVEGPAWVARPLSHPALGSLQNLPEIADWIGDGARRWFQQVAIERTQRFYEQMSRNQEKRPSFFAEKVEIKDATSMLEVFGDGREIFLMRDPRDQLCSIFAFNEKRGYEGFGTEGHASKEDYIRAFRGNIEARARHMEQHQDRLVPLRYEDLIETPEDTLKALFENLGIDSGTRVMRKCMKAAFKDRKTLAVHATTRSAKQSIGRWRRDLSPALQRVVEESLMEPIQRMGYE